MSNRGMSEVVETLNSMKGSKTHRPAGNAESAGQAGKCWQLDAVGIVVPFVFQATWRSIGVSKPVC